jgi:hypothetical protein
MIIISIHAFMAIIIAIECVGFWVFVYSGVDDEGTYVYIGYCIII